MNNRVLAAAGWILIAATAASAQTSGTAWRKWGTSAVESGLAGAAGGPVAHVWFSADGARLFAQTANRGTYSTIDLQTWTAESADSVWREPGLQPAPARLPEARVTLRAGTAGRRYAFGASVYLSDDEGRTWLNLTAVGSNSVIGENPHDLTVSPADAQLVAVANDAGAWVSHDGGLSWSGLNDGLPNLPIRTLLSGNRIAVEGVGFASWQGRAGWVKDFSPPPEGDVSDADLRTEASARIGTVVRTVAGSGNFWYAGTADGRVWVSSDVRLHWVPTTVQTAGPVERFFVNADAPRIAFAVAASRGAHLFRTVNGGFTWLDITASLSDAPAHGITADRTSGAVYVATDKGVFLSRMDPNALTAPSPWVSVSQGLPAAPVLDIRLDRTSLQLSAAVDGYGVYVAPAPHQSTPGRIVNAADLTGRAAAPGGLISALGIAVDSAASQGIQFPVLARSSESSQLQVPFGTEPSQVSLQLNRTVTVGFTVKAAAPAIFVDRDGAPLLLEPETGMMHDNAQPTPARARVQLLATGLGRVTPDWPTGVPAPSSHIPAVAAEVRAFLNGSPIEVTSATLAPGYVGMYLVEIELPALLDAGLADLYITAGGESSNHVRLAVAY